MSKNILPRLVDQTSCQVLIVRHGSILAVGHILHGIAMAAETNNKNICDFVGMFFYLFNFFMRIYILKKIRIIRGFTFSKILDLFN